MTSVSVCLDLSSRTRNLTHSAPCLIAPLPPIAIGAKYGFSAYKASKIPKWGLSFGQSRIAINSAQLFRKNSTVIGHALSKHAGRTGGNAIWGKITGHMRTWNSQGMKHFREILRGPGKFNTVGNKGLNFLEKRLQDGRGVRLNMDGTFKGFID